MSSQKTKAKFKFAETNKKGIALLYYSAFANWELNGSKCWKEYVEKYPLPKDYDKHLEDLEIKEKKEFFSDFVGNVNKYCNVYKIIAVKEKEQERVL